MWKAYAAARGLPWLEISTFEVALREEDQARLEKYRQWGLANGMREDELELLTSSDVRRYEPNVRCHGAIWSKTDTAVDYREFTQSVRDDAEAAGAKFLLGSEVASVDVAGDLLEVRLAAPEEERVYIDPRRKISVHVGRGREAHRTRFLINCAGGNSIDIAHRLGVGREYTDLHFRGEYWEIDPAHHYLSSRNIYTVPRHPELPFLDPHWIVRADGRREIGPNAVPVAGPYTYRGFFRNPVEAIKKIFEQPIANKIALLYNRDFLELAGQEWLSSISKGEMARRAQEFIPELKVQYLTKPGIAGVRAQVIDRNGNFIKEAIELKGPGSYHITNYNSPGATGSPAFAAWVVNKLGEDGHLNHLTRNLGKRGIWDFAMISEQIEMKTT